MPRTRPDRVNRSARIDVTTAQRARLILSLGVLNLVLATIALGVGGVGLQQRSEGPARPPVAVVTNPTPTTPGVAPGRSSAPSPGTAGPTAAPSPGTLSPAPTTSPVPTIATGSASPGTVPAATGGPSVTGAPAATPTAAPSATPRPTAARTAQPTAQPTAAPTARATAKPTPKPTAVVAKPGNGTKAKAHPPCPSKYGPPPGHAKTQDPHKPCGNGGGKGGNDKDTAQGGIVLILPLMASATAWAVRPRRLRPRRRAR
jgi:hypothetical protein